MLARYLANPFFHKHNYSSQTLAQYSKVFSSYMSDNTSNVMAQDHALEFYFLNHAVSLIIKKRHRLENLTTGERKVIELYIDKSILIGQRAFYYLFLICMREMRHIKGKVDGTPIKEYVGALGLNFSNLMVGDVLHQSSGTVVTCMKKTNSQVELGMLTTQLTHMFNQGEWSGGYGGKAWGSVAQCLNRFVTGTISMEMMVDTVWTLAHNNGPIFNKGFLYEGSGSQLPTILDVQRSGQIPNLLWDSIYGKQYFTIMYAVKELYKDVLDNLGSPQELNNPIDWQLVEDLGSKNTYKTYKEKQNKSNKITPKKPIKKPDITNKPIFTMQDPKDYYVVDATTKLEKIQVR